MCPAVVGNDLAFFLNTHLQAILNDVDSGLVGPESQENARKYLETNYGIVGVMVFFLKNIEYDHSCALRNTY